MHKDIVKISSNIILKPNGRIHVVYFSSISNNTHRFIEKTKINNSRIPIEIEKKLVMNQDYVLITPTYAAGGNKVQGAVPKQVINFLNNEINRNYCKGVIASGNTNFGDTFAIAGPIISKKLNVPLLYQFELLGTVEDVEQVKKILNEFWEK